MLRLQGLRPFGVNCALRLSVLRVRGLDFRVQGLEFKLGMCGLRFRACRSVDSSL